MTPKLYKHNSSPGVYVIVTNRMRMKDCIDYIRYDTHYNLIMNLSADTNNFTKLYTEHDDEQIMKMLKLLEL